VPEESPDRARIEGGINNAEGMRILVIDDEKQIRRMLKAGLSGYGYDMLKPLRVMKA